MSNKEKLNSELSALGFDVDAMETATTSSKPAPASPLVPYSPVSQQVPQESMSFIDSLKEQVPDVLGFAGSMAPLLRATPAGRVASPFMKGVQSLAGGILGVGTGENLRQLMIEDGDPYKVLDKMTTEAMFGVVPEAVTQAFTTAKPALTKLRFNNQDSLTKEEMENLQYFFREMEMAGVPLTPAQLTGSEGQRILENIALAGIGGTGRMTDRYVAQNEWFDNYLDDIVETIGSRNAEETGVQFQKAMDEAHEDLQAWAAPKFQEITEMAAGQKVNFEGSRAWVEQGRARAMLGREKAASPNELKEIMDLYKHLEGQMIDSPANGAFNLLRYLTTKQREIASDTTKTTTTVQKAYRDAIEEVLKDIDLSMQQTGNNPLLQYWKGVREVYKDTTDLINDEAVLKLVRLDPEFVGENIARQGNVTTLQKAFDAIDEAGKLADEAGRGKISIGSGSPVTAEQLKNNVRAGYIENLLLSARETQDTAKGGLAVLQSILKNNKTRRTFEQALTPEQQKSVRSALAFGTYLERNSAGNFSLIVRGAQSGQARKVGREALNQDGIFSFGKAATAMAIIGAPSFLAKRAVEGKVSKRYMQEMSYLIDRFDKGQFTASDYARLMGFMVNNSSDFDDVPPEFAVRGLTATEVYKKEQLDAELEDMGFSLDAP
jgi:hypothetical protein